jgi:hypothetical protein
MLQVPGAGPHEDVQVLAERLRLLRDLGARARGGPGDPLAELASAAFRVQLLEALARRAPAGSSQPTAAAAAARTLPLPPPAFDAAPVPPAEDRADPAPAAPPGGADSAHREAEVIRRTAERAGIDPDFLTALRRVENGGPGREFGVLSVPAPTYEEQARVAAESIRRSLQRFEAAGGQPVDVRTGRYTEAFIRFFSARYAPLGAANDPGDLNRHHAPNLIRRYAAAARPAVTGAPSA